MNYQAKMVGLVKVLLKIFARGLPMEWICPPDVFEAATTSNPVIPVRLLHYAPQSVKDERQCGGMLFPFNPHDLYVSRGSKITKMSTCAVGDHSDFGCVTILLQEPGTEGLEVFYPPTESWIPVPVKENSFVINIGDVMQKWTGEYYRSARHRVVASASKHRYSVPFFLNGDPKLKFRALDGSGEETAIGEHIRKRVMETVGIAAQVQAQTIKEDVKLRES